MDKIEITPELLGELKEKAEKANLEPYEFDADTIIDKLCLADGEYIAAANPQVVLALVKKIEELEKEADWLANKLADDAGLILDPPCGGNCNLCDMPCRQEQWREAARKAVEEQCKSN